MLIYIKLLFTALLWGGNFIVGRLTVANADPLAIAFWRFTIASVFFLSLTWKIEGKLPRLTRRQLITVILFGMTGVFMTNLLLFKGLKLIEASRAAVIVAINPIFIALLSSYFFKEKLSWGKALGIVLSVTGAVLVILKGNLASLFDGNIGLGEVYILVNALSWAVASLIGKSLVTDLSPLVSVTYGSVVGTVALFCALCWEGNPQHILLSSYKSWFGLSYLGFFGTVLPFIWYYGGIRDIGPTRTSLFINFVPISAIVLAFFILDEPITRSLLLGTLFVSCGVYLTNTQSVKR